MGNIRTNTDLKVVIENILKTNYPLKLVKKNNNTVEIDNNKFHVVFTHLKVSNDCQTVSYRVVLRRKNLNNSDVNTVIGSFLVNVNEIEERVMQVINHLYKLQYLGISADNTGIILDMELDKIVQEVLEIPTLKTRKMDEYDFHEVSVWGLKEALKRAYELGLDVGYELGKNN